MQLDDNSEEILLRKEVKVKVYLDNCCFNRPFDDQSQIRIRLEAEAKLKIQEEIRSGNIQLAWSYILDYENSKNPFQEKKEQIVIWRKYAKHAYRVATGRLGML